MKRLFILVVVLVFSFGLVACNESKQIKGIINEISTLSLNNEMSNNEKMKKIFLINKKMSNFDQLDLNNITNYDSLKQMENEMINRIVIDNEWTEYVRNSDMKYYTFNDIIKEYFESHESVNYVDIITGFKSASTPVNDIDKIISMLDLPYIAFDDINEEDFYNDQIDVTKTHIVGFFSDKTVEAKFGVRIFSNGLICIVKDGLVLYASLVKLDVEDFETKFINW